MPQGCLSKNCIDCESRAIVSGKIDCNYMNRLGITTVTVKNFLDAEKKDEPLFVTEDSVSELDKQLEELRKKKEALVTKKGGGTLG